MRLDVVLPALTPLGVEENEASVPLPARRTTSAPLRPLRAIDVERIGSDVAALMSIATTLKLPHTRLPVTHPLHSCAIRMHTVSDLKQFVEHVQETLDARVNFVTAISETSYRGFPRKVTFDVDVAQKIIMRHGSAPMNWDGGHRQHARSAYAAPAPAPAVVAAPAPPPLPRASSAPSKALGETSAVFEDLARNIPQLTEFLKIVTQDVLKRYTEAETAFGFTRGGEHEARAETLFKNITRNKDEFVEMMAQMQRTVGELPEGTDPSVVERKLKAFGDDFIRLPETMKVNMNALEELSQDSQFALKKPLYEEVFERMGKAKYEIKENISRMSDFDHTLKNLPMTDFETSANEQVSNLDTKYKAAYEKMLNARDVDELKTSIGEVYAIVRKFERLAQEASFYVDRMQSIQDLTNIDRTATRLLKEYVGKWKGEEGISPEIQARVASLEDNLTGLSKRVKTNIQSIADEDVIALEDMGSSVAYETREFNKIETEIGEVSRAIDKQSKEKEAAKAEEEAAKAAEEAAKAAKAAAEEAAKAAKAAEEEAAAAAEEAAKAAEEASRTANALAEEIKNESTDITKLSRLLDELKAKAITKAHRQTLKMGQDLLKRLTAAIDITSAFAFVNEKPIRNDTDKEYFDYSKDEDTYTFRPKDGEFKGVPSINLPKRIVKFRPLKEPTQGAFRKFIENEKERIVDFDVMLKKQTARKVPKVVLMLGASGSGKSFATAHNLRKLREKYDTEKRTNPNLTWKLKIVFAYGTATYDEDGNLKVKVETKEWTPQPRTTSTPAAASAAATDAAKVSTPNNALGLFEDALAKNRFADNIKESTTMNPYGLGAVSLLELVCQTNNIPDFKVQLIMQTRNNPKSSRGSISWMVCIGEDCYILLDLAGNETAYSVISGVFNLDALRDAIMARTSRTQAVVEDELVQVFQSHANAFEGNDAKVTFEEIQNLEGLSIHSSPLEWKIGGGIPERKETPLNVNHVDSKKTIAMALQKKKTQLSDLKFTQEEWDKLEVKLPTHTAPGTFWFRLDGIIYKTTRKFGDTRIQLNANDIRRMVLERNKAIEDYPPNLREKLKSAYIPEGGTDFRAMWNYVQRARAQSLYIKFAAGAFSAFLPQILPKEPGMRLTIPFVALEKDGSKKVIRYCRDNDNDCSNQGVGMFYPFPIDPPQIGTGNTTTTLSTREINRSHVRNRRKLVEEITSGQHADVYPIKKLLHGKLDGGVMPDVEAQILIPTSGSVLDAVVTASKFLVRQVAGEKINKNDPGEDDANELAKIAQEQLDLYKEDPTHDPGVEKMLFAVQEKDVATVRLLQPSIRNRMIPTNYATGLLLNAMVHGNILEFDKVLNIAEAMEVNIGATVNSMEGEGRGELLKGVESMRLEADKQGTEGNSVTLEEAKAVKKLLQLIQKSSRPSTTGGRVAGDI